MTGEVIPLVRPMKPESLEPPDAGKVIATAASAYIGGVLGPGVEAADLEAIGSKTSSYLSSLFRVASSVAACDSLGMEYTSPGLAFGAWYESSCATKGTECHPRSWICR